MTQRTLKKKRYGEYIRRSPGEKTFDVFNILLMLALVGFFLFPLMNMLSISLSNEYAVLRGDVTFYPQGINLQAYEQIFSPATRWRGKIERHV